MAHPVVSQGVVEAINAYAQQVQIQLNKEDRAQIESCVSIWTKAEDCGAEFCRILAIIWEAIKSIFCQSQWQKTSRMLVERTTAGPANPGEEGAKAAAEFALNAFVRVNEEHEDSLGDAAGFRRAVQMQTQVALTRQMEQAGRRLEAAAASGDAQAAVAALGGMVSSLAAPVPSAPRGSAPSSSQPYRAPAPSALAAAPASSDEARLRRELISLSDEHQALIPDDLMPSAMKAQARQIAVQALSLVPAAGLSQAVEEARQKVAAFRAKSDAERRAEMGPQVAQLKALRATGIDPLALTSQMMSAATAPAPNSGAAANPMAAMMGQMMRIGMAAQAGGPQPDPMAMMGQMMGAMGGGAAPMAPAGQMGPNGCPVQ